MGFFKPFILIGRGFCWGGGGRGVRGGVGKFVFLHLLTLAFEKVYKSIFSFYVVFILGHNSKTLEPPSVFRYFGESRRVYNCIVLCGGMRSHVNSDCVFVSLGFRLCV